MNKRNIAALTSLIEMAALVSYFDKAVSPSGSRRLAEELAGYGVLVPSALTDEEGYDISMIGDFTMTRCEEREATEARLVRDELERTARGERRYGARKAV